MSALEELREWLEEEMKALRNASINFQSNYVRGEEGFCYRSLNKIDELQNRCPKCNDNGSLEIFFSGRKYFIEPCDCKAKKSEEKQP